MVSNNRGGHETGARNPRTDSNREQFEKDKAVSRDPDIRGVNKSARDERPGRGRR